MVSLLLLVAFADVPDLSNDVLKPACDRAIAAESCPACTCAMVTSTSPHEADMDAVGVVLRVEGEHPETKAQVYAHHLAIGSKTKLTWVGRLGAWENKGPVWRSEHNVEAFAQVMQMCPGDCGFEAYGIIHPFVSKLETRATNLENYHDKVVIDASLVLCWETTEPVCVSVPIGHEEREEAPPVEPGMKLKVFSKALWTRTWKLGDQGELQLGKPQGKLAKQLRDGPGSTKLSGLVRFGVATPFPKP